MKRVRDEYRRTASEPAREEQIQSRTVRTGDARHAFAASTQLAIIQLPIEKNLCVAAWQFRMRKYRGCWCASQWTQAWRTRRGGSYAAGKKRRENGTAHARVGVRMRSHYRVLPENVSGVP